MQIKQEILDYVMEINAVHQPATIAGTYDGAAGTLTMTFVNDVQTYQMDFEYLGSEYLEFRERVCQVSGRLVAAHNTYIGIPSRQPFLDSVTE